MNPTIERLKLIFLGIFAVANVGVLVWQLGWAASRLPRKSGRPRHSRLPWHPRLLLLLRWRVRYKRR